MKSPSCWLTLSWGDGDQDQMWEQRLVLGGSPNHALLRVCLAHHPASSAEVLLGWLWSLLGSWGTDWRVMGTRTRGRHLIITWDLECFHIVWGWLLGVGVAALLLYHWLTSRSRIPDAIPARATLDIRYTQQSISGKQGNLCRMSTGHCWKSSHPHSRERSLVSCVLLPLTACSGMRLFG